MTTISDERRIDLALALTVGGVTTVGVWTELHWAFQISPPQQFPPGVVAYVLVAVASAAMLLRRSHPGLAALIVLATVYAYHLLGYPGLAIAMVCYLAVYSIVVRGRRWPVPTAGLVILLTWVAPSIRPYPVPLSSAALIGPMLSLVSTALIGVAIRQRRAAADERLRQVARTAEAELGQRLAEERLRIARELHDVLAHTVSVIAVQAGVALDALDDDVPTARAALHIVRAAARQAGPELRAAVGPLRTSDVDALGLSAVAAPAPRLDSIEELLAPARAAGLTATVRLEPGDEPLSHPVELTAFRIVQESLTNVVRHARARRVDVSVTRVGEALEVEVRDDGVGPAGGSGAGLGIVGMRERVQLLAGTLEASPVDGRGFRVRARLPLSAVELGPAELGSVESGPASVAR
jgi:signal transduction histidine kinase